MPKNNAIDLHVHSVFSDGKLTPAELAALAKRNNVAVLAVTDHDTLAGSEEKAAACAAQGIECVQGVELSCELDGREAHILSLFADPASPELAAIDSLTDSRRERMGRMLEKLASLGIHVGIEDLPVADDGVYGRPHLARALVEKGIVRSVSEAFKRYLYDGGPVHIDKTRLGAAEGIALAKRLGGVAVLAHPGVSGWLGALDRFAELGLDAIEAYHPKNTGEATAKILRFCAERSLLVSGGSDFHSPGDGADLGSVRMPSGIMEPLRRLADERKG